MENDFERTLQALLKGKLNPSAKSSALEETARKDESKKAKGELIEEKKLDLQQDRSERKIFARRVYWLVVGYLLVVFILIFMAGFKLIVLHDSILIGLITTLAINVLGIFHFVMKYLFSR